MAHIGPTVTVLFCLFVLTSAGTPFPYKDCGSKHGRIIRGSLDPPPVGDCTFKRGDNVTATLVVEIDEVTSHVNIICKGKLAFFLPWVPFKVPNPDACALGVNCPTKSGTQYTIHSSIPINSDYPDISLQIQMDLMDANSDAAICLEFEAKICG